MSDNLITNESYRQALALRDLTDAAGGGHAMQMLVEGVIRALAEAWKCPVIIHRAPPLVSIQENYEDLDYPPNGPARDRRYTRYVTKTKLLRTHMSALIPGALREIARAPYRDVLLVAPGLCYRRDAVDRLHVGEPHQVDLWRISDRLNTLGTKDLEHMIAQAVQALLPGATYRTTRTSHPYTEGGLEVEVKTRDEWVELLECGLTSPRVLNRCGLDPTLYSGLAMGVGLDRALMLRKGIPDIRLLRSTDPRVLTQMQDLSPYKTVSSLPPVKRDLSLAVPLGQGEEELGDILREGLRSAGIEDWAESLSVIAETALEDLPPAAIGRIGIEPGQKNVLVRLIIRHPTKTLTDKEANRVRDLAYELLHQGTAYEWTSDKHS